MTRKMLSAGIVAIATATAVLAPAGSAVAEDAPPGATACSGCHSAARAAQSIVPRLHGRPAQATVAAMQAFKAGRLPATVMDRIARGFSDAEIAAIAEWYASRR